ncbi:hypothetical protein SODG_006585 [Sodalis praecaptivus]
MSEEIVQLTRWYFVTYEIKNKYSTWEYGLFCRGISATNAAVEAVLAIYKKFPDVDSVSCVNVRQATAHENKLFEDEWQHLLKKPKRKGKKSMKQSQEVIVARIIAASKDIVACEKAMVTLKDIYRTAMHQYFREHGDPGIDGGRLSPDNPEYEGVIKHTDPYFIAMLKKKRELHNARRRHSRATQALIKYQTEKDTNHV